MKKLNYYESDKILDKAYSNYKKDQPIRSSIKIDSIFLNNNLQNKTIDKNIKYTAIISNNKSHNYNNKVFCKKFNSTYSTISINNVSKIPKENTKNNKSNNINLQYNNSLICSNIVKPNKSIELNIAESKLQDKLNSIKKESIIIDINSFNNKKNTKIEGLILAKKEKLLLKKPISELYTLNTNYSNNKNTGKFIAKTPNNISLNKMNIITNNNKLKKLEISNKKDNFKSKNAKSSHIINNSNIISNFNTIITSNNLIKHKSCISSYINNPTKIYNSIKLQKKFK